MKDPYDVLGVQRAATADDIQKAYRKLAKKFHPDLNPGKPEAEERFKEIAGAYDLVGDVDKRLKFDHGEIDASGDARPRKNYYRDHQASSENDPYATQAGFTDFMDSGDAFADFLRRGSRASANRRGHDLAYRFPISFVESVVGASKLLTMPNGSTLDVVIPPGMVDGQILRLRGKGSPGAGEGEFGDALITIEVLSDRRFRRVGDDVEMDLHVSLSEAVQGAHLIVSTPSGDVTMTVPKRSNTGTKLRLKGRGAPRSGGGHGDLFVTLRIMLSGEPDADLEAFLAAWPGGKTFNPREDRVS